MTEAVEGGAGIAWKLLATLEGGSLLLATSALLAYTARARGVRRKRERNVQRVLITNTSNALGKDLKIKLEARCCTVSTDTSGAISGADDKIDALVVVGCESLQHTMSHVADLVSEDVFKNLKLMESLSPRLRRGGCIAWVCAGATSGAYGDAIAAFDSVLRANLQHIAQICHCDAVWLGRCETAERAVQRALAELLPTSEQTNNSTQTFSIRTVAHKASEYLGRWLKRIT